MKCIYLPLLSWDAFTMRIGMGISSGWTGNSVPGTSNSLRRLLMTWSGKIVRILVIWSRTLASHNLLLLNPTSSQLPTVELDALIRVCASIIRGSLTSTLVTNPGDCDRLDALLVSLSNNDDTTECAKGPLNLNRFSFPLFKVILTPEGLLNKSESDSKIEFSSQRNCW